MLIFVVCGFGFIGIEMVGEFLEWKDCFVKDNKIDVFEIKLVVVEVVLIILNMFERRDVDKVECYMVKKGIEIMKNVVIVEVKFESIVFKFGEEFLISILIWIVGVCVNFDIKDYGMEFVCVGCLKVN